MYVHLNQQFQCPHCDRLFSRPKTLHDHIRDAHLQYARKNLDDLLREEEQVVLPPVVDPGSSKAKKSRKRAATTADNEEDEGASVSANFSDAFMNSLKTSETKCPVCGRSCDSFKSFEEHIFTHISRLIAVALCASNSLSASTISSVTCTRTQTSLSSARIVRRSS